MKRTPSVIYLATLVVLIAGCGGGDSPVAQSFPLDSLDEIIDRGEDLSLDRDETTDGGGSLHVAAKDKRVVSLIEAELPEVSAGVIRWSGRARCMGIPGRVVLAARFVAADGGEFTARGNRTFFHSSRPDWDDIEVVFPVPAGKRIVSTSVSISMDSNGYFWLDDLRLTVTPAGSGG